MTLTVTCQRELPADWESLADDGGFYHRRAWIETIARSFRYPLHVVTARRDARLVGALALARVPGVLRGPRLVSFPFSYAAGPLGVDDVAIGAVMAAARDLAGRLRAHVLEVKHFPRSDATADVAPAPIASGFSRVWRYAAYRVAPAPDVATLFAALDASHTRRSVRKAQRMGVVVAASTSAADWGTLAELQAIVAQRHGVPAPPRAFFTVACARLQVSGLADLYVARTPDGDPLAAAAVWRGRHEHIYAFGAARPATNEWRPIHALLWHALQAAHEAGVGFDLGRAAPEQASLVRFKERWAGVAVPLAYDYSPRPRGPHVRARSAGSLGALASVWRRLPPRLARHGSVLYRYLG